MKHPITHKEQGYTTRQMALLQAMQGGAKLFLEKDRGAYLEMYNGIGQLPVHANTFWSLDYRGAFNRTAVYGKYALAFQYQEEVM